jgi:hypothetical protein
MSALVDNWQEIGCMLLICFLVLLELIEKATDLPGHD